MALEKKKASGEVIVIQLPTKPLQCFVVLQYFACNLGNKIAVNKKKYMVERPIYQLCNGIGIKYQNLCLEELWLVL